MRQAVLAGFALLIIGCATPANTARPARAATRPATAPAINRDDCATRLHEISGALLLYISQNHHLPQRLKDLSDVPGAPAEWTCPVSGQPYVFDPAGLPTADPTMRVFVYDAVASHNGMRWGIALSEARGSEPVIAKVVVVPR